MNEKQQQLTFDKGITNVPSDALCSDNALEESLGMIYEDGEHRVIQKPIEQMYTNTAFSAIMLYIHKYNDKKRYIFVRHIPRSQNPDTLDWAQDSVTGTTTGTFSGIDISDIDKLCITSVGKTLIVTDPNGIHYFIWKDDDYVSLATPFPTIKFDAYLSDDYIYLDGVGWLDMSFVKNTQKADGIITGDSDSVHIVDGEKEKWNDIAIGLYSKNLKGIAQMKSFAEPFFIRLALELYDGSFTFITTPMLLFPTATKSSYIRVYSNLKEVEMTTLRSKLFISQLQDYSDYSDIIKDVVVFVSDGIRIYDTGVDQPLSNISSSNVVYNRVVKKFIPDGSSYTLGASTYSENLASEFSSYVYSGLKEREQQEIINDINSTSIFYKLCSLGLKPIEDFDVASKIETHTLENLTSQQRLDADDYYSHCKLLPKYIYSYNSRLNLARVKRDFFGGFDKFIAWDKTDAEDVAVYDTYTIYVTIKTDTGTVVISHQTESISNRQGMYFFYPDSRATNVVIKNSSNVTILDAELTEHKGLNGAYYFCGLPASTPPTPDTSAEGRTQPTELQTEMLPNYIITSEVNNPYVFKAEGYYSVGVGKILAMSSITQALSEGQFGQFPLLVFSESGIWSLSVASTGYYDSIHPMSREVCNNVKSITQTDGAVFFTSEKGLMVVVGNQVKCVSEQLSGKEGTFNGCIELGNFHDYLKKCYIAYDYRDSLLWIFSTQTVNNVEVPYEYCWIYSIKSGTFGKYNYSGSQVVNDYPDYLISDYTHFDSLVDRPNINLDTRTYSGRLISRPMKLENALALKSIMQIRHIHDMNEDATLTLRIFASNNLKNWVELHSLRGTPWKYYRFRYDFSNLIATDRFAGTMLITQERRTNKLR